MERPKTQRDYIRANAENIKQMRAEGKSWRAIADHFGVNQSNLMLTMHPERERFYERGKRPFPRMLTESRVEVLGELPPLDTRDLTARLMGDPLPGRSYLDRMRQQQGGQHG